MNRAKQWIHGMVADHQLEQDVREELAYDPAVGRAPELELSVNQGTVEISGTVCSLAQRQSIEHAVRRVDGVLDVVNRLHVDPPKHLEHADQDIANAVATVLEWTAGVPDGIAVSALDGCITLDGTVELPCERTAADLAAQRTVGVTRVENHLAVRSLGSAERLRSSVEAALRRCIRGENVLVEVYNDSVSLGGTVRSWAARARADEAARRAAGVREVLNRIEVAESAAEIVS